MKIFLRTFGCQMNEYDSEIVSSVLTQNNFEVTEKEEEASVILLNTCAVRENAHQKVYNYIKNKPKTNQKRPYIGILGCMATNLRKELLEREDVNIDFIAGPDSYRKLPELIMGVFNGEKKLFDVTLSEFETYEDIYPKHTAGINAWIAVMRGCDNFCTFCVVPYTRGRERSRSPESVLKEARQLAQMGYKQITLLGQNVNSYQHDDVDFADLIEMISGISGIERVRFTSPHPKDFPVKLLEVIRDNPKACNQIHLPLQAGNDRVLKMMNRTYTGEEFLDLVKSIRHMIPDVSLSTDIIVGFPTETDNEFNDTYRILKEVEFDSAFIFKYSERKNTKAIRKFPDDVSEEVKKERIIKLNELQRGISYTKNLLHIGQEHSVLIEKGYTKKSDKEYQARNDGNKIVILEKGPYSVGDFVKALIIDATPNVLKGKVVNSNEKNYRMCSNGHGIGYR